MEDNNWDPNGGMVCPYDASHFISVQRFQRHLIKCRQNHPDKDYVSCPFNAKHILLREELRLHLGCCTDRVQIDHDVRREECPETGEMLRLKGKTSLPAARCHVPDDLQEDWDTEIEENMASKLNYQESYLRKQGFLPVVTTTTNKQTQHRKAVTVAKVDNDAVSSTFSRQADESDGDFDEISSILSEASKTSSLYVLPAKQKHTPSVELIQEARSVNARGISNSNYKQGKGRGNLQKVFEMLHTQHYR